MLPNESEYGYLISSNRSSADYPSTSLLVTKSVSPPGSTQGAHSSHPSKPCKAASPPVCFLVLFSSSAHRKQHLMQPQSCQLSGLSRKEGGESPLTLPSATDHHWTLLSAAWGCSFCGQTLQQVPCPTLTFFCLCHSQPTRNSWSAAVVTKRCCQACRQACRTT